MTFAEIVSRLPGARPTASGYEARCPSHDDHRASLSLTQAPDGKILLHCHTGCTFDAICAALQIKPADLFQHRNGKPSTRREVAAYDYTDRAGKLLFQVVRFEPKDFRQRAPDPTCKDGWTWTTKGVRKVLYRLPEIRRDVARGLPILVCEGEKDALALVDRGFSATTNPGGAGKWLDDYTATLRAADVVIIPDADDPGRKHAALVASRLTGTAARVRVFELPAIANKLGAHVKDAHDFFAAGGTAQELQRLIDEAPDWTPEAAPKHPPAVEAQAGPADIRGQIISILLDKDLKAPAQRTKIAKAVVEALAIRGRFYFHADRRDFDSAMFFDGERKQLERIRGDAFSAWLSEWLSLNRADVPFRYILAAVETAALAGAHTTGILPEAVWAARSGAVYLSNGDGRIVKATARGLAALDNGADGILFSAGRTLAPWQTTDPGDPFQTCSLFATVQTAAEHGADLLRLWLYSLPTCPRSKPPLCLAGDIGSGKTRLAKGFAELYGLPFVASKVEDDAESDFWPNLDQGGLLTLDNADSRCRWLADSIANASTDGCSRRRKLYTDAETVTLRARAWIAVTTCNPLFASDAGLADRLLLVRMNRRQEETSDAALADEIAANRDAALSHIALTIAAALADTQATPRGLNARHPDFAAFAVKLGRAVGREAQAIAALRAAESDKAAFCLENDAIAAALLAYLRDARAFTGTAAELVPKLAEVDPDLKEKLSAKRLSKRLGMLWPHLGKTLAVARKEADRNHFTIYTLKTANAEFAEFQTVFPGKS